MTRSAEPPRETGLLLELYAASQSVKTLVDTALADLPIQDVFALTSAINAFGPIRLTELAHLLGLPLTTASDQVRRVVDRGLVERVPNPGDRRSHLLRTTAAGKQEVEAAFPAFGRMIERVRANLRSPVDEVRAHVRELDEAMRAALTEI